MHFFLNQIVIFACFLISLSSCGTNQEPCNINFIFALPWDIANTLRAPLAAPLSIVLAGGLALICFAGLAFAPVWYIFGFPVRKYRMHTVKNEGRSLSFQDMRNVSISLQLPTVSQGVSFFLPKFFDDYKDEECRKLLLCHSHGFLTYVPKNWVSFYRFFSTKIFAMTLEEEAAIKSGIADQGECAKIFWKCDIDIVKMGKETLYYNIPGILKRKWKLQMK